ncbi:hypothetical protein TcasGA2_TC002010 [Tribolium castaneum]|uniref:Endonuclease/exonuclease/phosphatase domain-containing protein n=1 Tax=Tribolium castaneum TaxID=7070 RepID=D7EKG4_TRICA|nr:hypothetical protein TcasGA2_TC002010 [Tribolium castaneum]
MENNEKWTTIVKKRNLRKVEFSEKQRSCKFSKIAFNQRNNVSLNHFSSDQPKIEQNIQHSPDEEKFQIYYQNVRGLRTKLSELYNNILCEQYPVIVLTETLLNPDINNSEFIDTNKYMVFRSDRSPEVTNKFRGGGVLIAVEKNFPSNQVQCDATMREELWVFVYVNSSQLIIGATYIPPNANFVEYSNHLDSLALMSTNYPDAVLCVLGDYNLPGVSWLVDTDCDYLVPNNVFSAAEEIICDNFAYFGLFQYNNIANDNGPQPQYHPKVRHANVVTDQRKIRGPQSFCYFVSEGFPYSRLEEDFLHQMV